MVKRHQFSAWNVPITINPQEMLSTDLPNKPVVGFEAASTGISVDTSLPLNVSPGKTWVTGTTKQSIAINPKKGKHAIFMNLTVLETHMSHSPKNHNTNIHKTFDRSTYSHFSSF